MIRSRFRTATDFHGDTHHNHDPAQRFRDCATHDNMDRHECCCSRDRYRHEAGYSDHVRPSLYWWNSPTLGHLRRGLNIRQERNPTGCARDHSRRCHRRSASVRRHRHNSGPARVHPGDAGVPPLRRQTRTLLRHPRDRRNRDRHNHNRWVGFDSARILPSPTAIVSSFISHDILLFALKSMSKKCVTSDTVPIVTEASPN